METVGRFMVATGLALAALGAIVWLVGPHWQGRGGLLPGDISIRRPGFSLHLPIVTCLVASILLSLLARWFRR